MNHIILILSSLAIGFWSCTSNKKILTVPVSKNPQTIRMDLRIINNVKGDDKKHLLFVFHNDFQTLDSTLYLNYPCFGENVQLKLFRDGVEQNKQKLIRFTGECQKKRIEVQPDSSLEIKLNYYLDDLFKIEPNAKYVLQVSYSGIIYLKNEKVLKDNRSIIFNTIEW